MTRSIEASRSVSATAELLVSCSPVAYLGSFNGDSDTHSHGRREARSLKGRERDDDWRSWAEAQNILRVVRFQKRCIGNFLAPRFTLVKEALIEIGCVVTSLVGCHARALWPNGAS